MSRLSGPQATVNLSAIRHNYQLLLCRARQQDPSARLWCVVKANAYGHGLPQTVAALCRAGASRFATADLAEAEEVRKAAPDAQVLILGPTPASEVGRLWSGGFCQSVHTRAYAEELAAAAEAFFVAQNIWQTDDLPSDKVKNRWGFLQIALKLDCGIGRLGFSVTGTEALLPLCGLCFDALHFTEIYAHFSAADDLASPETEAQLSVFRTAVRRLRQAEAFRRAETHICASAGLMRFGTAECEAARCGLALYGYSPSPALAMAGLAPALTLRAPLLQVRRVGRGTPVGYGGRWRAPRATNVGILPLGYADGLLRACSGGQVLFFGHRVPLVGAVSMDLCAVDLGDLPASVGDTVTLIDPRGKLLPAMAAHAQTIPYELLSLLGPRIPRRYKNQS